MMFLHNFEHLTADTLVWGAEILGPVPHKISQDSSQDCFGNQLHISHWSKHKVAHTSHCAQLRQ